MIKNKRGFTLIEVLVVVLIIGILTAVAVPMYKHATLKSQFSTVMPPTKSLAEAQEVFYLNNGEYAEDKEELDLSVPDTAQTTVTVSDKRNYKFVKGHHTGVPGANYIIYQKNSRRFADNIHCEAAKTDDNAKWLCEKGLGGTLLTGSVSGADYLTYLLSGDAGTDRFIREDCPAGYYDNNGTCAWAINGHYAEDGELKPCPPGTATTGGPNVSCKPCQVGTYATGGNIYCSWCPNGMYQPEEGQSFCIPCPPGTATTGGTNPTCKPCQAGTYATGGNTYCSWCPNGMYQPEEGQSSCIPCPPGTATTGGTNPTCKPCTAGQYTDGTGYTYCKSCPSGQTNNAEHTGCVPA